MTLWGHLRSHEPAATLPSVLTPWPSPSAAAHLPGKSHVGERTGESTVSFPKFQPPAEVLAKVLAEVCASPHFSTHPREHQASVSTDTTKSRGPALPAPAALGDQTPPAGPWFPSGSPSLVTVDSGPCCSAGVRSRFPSESSRVSGSPVLRPGLLPAAGSGRQLGKRLAGGH